ncbi:MAG TPA: class IV adenylate cyclase [Candidatus Nanoarchaeia archaeon]|nr:class IV adenylate cyclase [Candidatus Nanoarchaeia archaeon]
MASNNQEIEIKIPVDGVTFSHIKQKLQSTATFVKSSSQIDEYFTPPNRNFVEPFFTYEWLSIRKRGGKTIINYKHFYPENAELTTHCDEFETIIENPEQIEKIFSALNMKKLVVVEKEREVFIYKNEFEIALDRVKELGNFIEIEAMKNFGTVHETREKLFQFAKRLGIDTSNADKRGYPHLLMKKKGLTRCTIIP